MCTGDYLLLLGDMYVNFAEKIAPPASRDARRRQQGDVRRLAANLGVIWLTSLRYLELR